MPHASLYYHIVWATKYRLPLISNQNEQLLHNLIKQKAIGLGGIVYALNGTHDHVHLALTIPPSQPVSRFVGQIKAVSSYKIKELRAENEEFYWQDGFFASTFQKKELKWFVRYIQNQKHHHQLNTTHPVFEMPS